MAASSRAETGETEYDRSAELRAFDETKAGVKGLVDAGIKEVPRIFFNPKGYFEENNNSYDGDKGILPELPIIDMDGIGISSITRKAIIDKMIDASMKWGFFQVINHGIPNCDLEEMIDATRKFFEQDDEIKKSWYCRDTTKQVLYNSNLNLYTLPQANWRDTLFCLLAPNGAAPEDLPDCCSKIMFKYSKEVKNLGSFVLELLSEGLEQHPNYLREKGGVEGLAVLSHYYPECPQPELTIGTMTHTDSTFFTVVLQDDIGGLQVLNQNRWIDVPTTPGALIVNIGDSLQRLSDEKFKSVKHRVLAHRVGPRISVAHFFTTTSKPGGDRFHKLQVDDQENEPKKCADGLVHG